MHLGFHGGKCCGIKVIKGFPKDPESRQSALEAIAPSSPDRVGNDVSSADRFFWDEAPEETSVERLDRYLKFLETHRPHGIVEIVLADSTYEYPNRPDIGKQTYKWRPLLEERGFKEVSNCHNSNSGNRIYVFHLCMDKVEERKS